MTPIDRTERESHIGAFLETAGWGTAQRGLLAGDASFRRYDRLKRGGETAVLMDAPPPMENVGPFLNVARLLGGLGFSTPRILVVHVLPNIMAEILVMGALWLANAIRTEASLAFIGLGLKPPIPTWGGMIREGFDNILDNAWLALVPGCAVLAVIFALNLIGDGLRDAIDPKLRDGT